jgi:hypothetical protein
MNNKFATPLTPISWGELIDKITILEIKQINIKSISALFNFTGIKGATPHRYKVI